MTRECSSCEGRSTSIPGDAGYCEKCCGLNVEPGVRAPSDDEYTAIVDGLQRQLDTWRGNADYRRRLELELHMISQYRRLDLGVRAVRRAIVLGRVCDDVAWFDDITTLFDYCSVLLDDVVNETSISAPAYPHPSRRRKPQNPERPILRRKP